MDRDEIKNLLDQLGADGVTDVRANPDDYRWRQFLTGWRDYSERDRHYVPQVLRRLTWRNLGWRLAREHHDPAGLDKLEIRDHYEIAEAIWWQRHR